MARSLNALKKLTKGESSNMVLEYQNEFDNDILSTINTETTSVKDRFTKTKSQLLVTRRVNNDLEKQNHVLEKICCK